MRAPSSPSFARARSPHRVLVSALVVLLTLGAGLLAGAPTVSAHTGFESSSPADGEVLTAPVSVVTIVFTGPATPFGDGFVALNAQGGLQEPTAVDALDDRTFAVTFEPPLSGGTTGLRWNVQAPDAHPIDGAFSFTVDAPAPTTTVAADEPTGPTTTAVAETDPAAATPADATPPFGDDPTAQVAPTMDEFLSATDDATPGERTARFGRVIGFLGVVLTLGGLAFAAAAFRGREDEVNWLLGAIRGVGVLTALGAAIEYVGVARIVDEGLATAWSTDPGFATVLRMAGGVAVALGLAATIVGGVDLRRSRPLRRPLSAAVLERDLAHDTDPTTGADRPVRRPRSRWLPDTTSKVAGAGAAALVVSFWFDGHTVSKGIRPLHAIVNSLHLLAAGVWAGGVVAITAICWRRWRRGTEKGVAEMVVRFSHLATVSLGAVVVAGGIMAVLVLDSFGELTGTEWGQILLLKTAAVGLAMAGGAYNHFVLLPQLERTPDDPTTIASLRSTVTAEAILLMFVVVVTAWLVAAAS